MILFVASNPSKLNTDPEVAIVGSKSEKTFNEWIEKLGVGENYKVVNVSNVVTEKNSPLKIRDFQLFHLANYTMIATKVIALGNTASDALDRINVEYFKLPHPSPRNRFLNNKVQVEAVLEECKKWLQ